MGRIGDAVKSLPEWLRRLHVWQGPWHDEDILERLGVVTLAPGTGAAHCHLLEGPMMHFGFRWISLGNLTEVQSLFPVEGLPGLAGQPDECRTPFLAGIARMREGDIWNENVGIAVAMVRFRDGGHYNRRERDLSGVLRKRAAENLPSKSWGDFYLTLGQFLEVMRIRSEFRIALAVETMREAESARWFEYVLAGPGGPLSEEDSDDPLERAVAAIRRVAGLPVTLRGLPSRKSITESAIAESCARRILKATGPFVHIKPTS